MSKLPTSEGKAALEANRSILSADEQRTVQLLLDNDQAHLFAHWPPAGEKDADKHRFLTQCALIESAYLGGIATYVSRAKQLLAFAQQGGNPYEGYKVQEPTDSARIDSFDAFKHYEALGLSAVSTAAFVIVAGGLGERLGYKGIKLALPSEIVTDTPYIQLYIQFILALQARARKSSGDASLTLPLAIMTSDDTDALTQQLLNENNNFGLAEGQLIVFKQGKVPSLLDNDAHFTLEEGDKYALDTKPHGHGDVHMLLYQNQIIQRWTQQQGRKHVVFFQDTNGLVFRAILAALGVSVEKGLEVNSLTVPRVQGDAVGAICKLVREAGSGNKSGEQLPDTLTINVEYNQLEGLMGKGAKEPLVSGTKNSVYPGNINVLIFDAVAYMRVLEEKKGAISEFVNPKYNADKQSFKKPTRLECMMQDWPKLLSAEAKVGFSEFQRWTSFSAVKNAIADAAAKQKDGNAPESGASGEADLYAWTARVLAEAGANVEQARTATYKGVQVSSGAKVVLTPAFGVTQEEIHGRVKGGDKVRIGADATVVLDGAITLSALDVHGALVVRAVDGAEVDVNGLTVSNAGWTFEEVADEKSVDQKYAVRGYTLKKSGGEEYVFDKPGKYTLSEQTKAQYKKA